jgi:hypothetical protein
MYYAGILQTLHLSNIGPFTRGFANSVYLTDTNICILQMVTITCSYNSYAKGGVCLTNACHDYFEF